MRKSPPPPFLHFNSSDPHAPRYFPERQAHHDEGRPEVHTREHFVLLSSAILRAFCNELGVSLEAEPLTSARRDAATKTASRAPASSAPCTAASYCSPSALAWVRATRPWLIFRSRVYPVNYVYRLHAAQTLSDQDAGTNQSGSLAISVLLAILIKATICTKAPPAIVAAPRPIIAYLGCVVVTIMFAVFAEHATHRIPTPAQVNICRANHAPRAVNFANDCFVSAPPGLARRGHDCDHDGQRQAANERF